jgi:hypothetical protein
VHFFEIREVDELDHELLGLLREARAIRDLEHQVQKTDPVIDDRRAPAMASRS